jgi:hypothetical protein
MRVVAKSGGRMLVELDHGRDAIYHVARDRLELMQPPVTRRSLLGQGYWERVDRDDAVDDALLRHVRTLQRCLVCGSEKIAFELRDPHLGGPLPPLRESYGEWLVCQGCGEQFSLKP